MSLVAILGAGDIAAAAAQALAARDCARTILLVDAAAGAAAGKALDIQQSGAVDAFHTRLLGTDDLSRIAGCSLCVVADRFAPGSPEWQGEDGLALLTRVVPYLSGAPLVFAGAAQAGLLAVTATEVGVARERLIGSAADAFASAVTAIAAMEARCSPGEVTLTVLGAPPAFVVPWSQASIGGYAFDRVLEQVQLARIEARAPRLWPPGAYTLGAAAARIAHAVLTSSRRTLPVLTMLDGEFGVRHRVGAVPALLSSRGIVHTRVPPLSTRDRVQVEIALGG